MKQKNLIILSVTIIICMAILSITALTIYNQDKTNNNSNSSNNTVIVSLNESNNTNNITSSNSQKTNKIQKKSSSTQSSKSDDTWGDYEDDEWVYGHGAGSSDDPDITWKHNKKTGFSEYYNSKAGDSWGGYNIA